MSTIYGMRTWFTDARRELTSGRRSTLRRILVLFKPVFCVCKSNSMLKFASEFHYKKKQKEFHIRYWYSVSVYGSSTASLFTVVSKTRLLVL